MIDMNRIDPQLLERVAELARQRRVPAQAIVEDALRSFLPHVERHEPMARTPMPQSTRLAQPNFDLEHASLGKLLEIDDEGLPIEKLR